MDKLKQVVYWESNLPLFVKQHKNIKIVIPKDGLSLQQNNFVLPIYPNNTNSCPNIINELGVYPPIIVVQKGEHLKYIRPAF